MTRTIEITDAMVERGLLEAQLIRKSLTLDADDVRAILETALNEPEIEVTEAMKEAGRVAYWKAYGQGGGGFSDQHWTAFIAGYRAMRRLEPKRRNALKTMSCDDVPDVLAIETCNLLHGPATTTAKQNAKYVIAHVVNELRKLGKV